MTVRAARGGPAYRLVPVVLALLVAASGVLGWLFSQVTS